MGAAVVVHVAISHRQRVGMPCTASSRSSCASTDIYQLASAHETLSRMTGITMYTPTVLSTRASHAKRRLLAVCALFVLMLMLVCVRACCEC